ncbi:MAG: hypothetical protein OXN17_02250 [Candidatus Poribacteria bacterium]|nr:hypothetical protein [Candidatus Poribacteria bacterium]MDE0504166.1 hypothetical protein [Candidatus Poribacteria bacterium]
MPTDRQLEVYRQLSESFRFQYRQEWQLLQVGTVTGLVILGVAEKDPEPVWWRFLISGAVFLGFSYAMYRMSKGNKENRPIWMSYARVIGDPTVNELGNWWTSAAVWGRVILFSAGVASLLYGAWKDSSMPYWSQCTITGIVAFVFCYAFAPSGAAPKGTNLTFTYWASRVWEYIVRKIGRPWKRFSVWTPWLVFIFRVILFLAGISFIIVALRDCWL